jgi:2-(1,2-epoxy-1,2-dihydrophenyl)acetyl-CoA isomerase
MGQALKYEQQGAVVTLTLSDPATRNALYGDGLFGAFENSVNRINEDLGVRAAILTGEGIAFCSGGNLRDMREKKGMFAGTPPQIADHYRRGIQRIPRALFRLDIPLIAAVNGPAIGAGCDLACMCDIRIASRKAVFAQSFLKVGLIPGDGGTWFLPRIVGYSRAAEMLFTGESLDADAACKIGLVSRVVAPEELMAEAMDLARRIARQPPRALRWAKRLLREAPQTLLDSNLEASLNYQLQAHLTADHAEGVAAALEKRTPKFTGD